MSAYLGGSNAEPCARCGQPSEVELWGLPSCRECHARWMAHPLTTAAELEKAAGVEWVRNLGATKNGKTLTREEYVDAIESVARRLVAKWRTKTEAA